jgi:hypothetical protein
MGRNKCEHNRQKYYCIECGGAGICEHKKQKQHCRECSVNGFCEHDRIKTQCKECKGGSICEHNKIRTRCIDCNGTGICEHNRKKEYCKECNGSQLCDHGTRKARCRDCNGNEICEHNKNKYECIECDGSMVCEHKKQKRYCIDCNGNSICEHNIYKERCLKCNGNQICQHLKRKERCIICNPELSCQLCKYILVNKNSKYYPQCFGCYCFLNPDLKSSRKYKLKENLLVDEIKINYPELNIIFDRKIDNACSKRRPDIRIELLTHTIIIECDEFQHIYTSCENKRMMELFQDLGERPIVFIRFNPDKYNNEESCFNKQGILLKKEWNKRIIILKNIIKQNLDNIPYKLVTIEYLFYNTN